MVIFYHVIFYSDIFWFRLPYICLCITLENLHVPLFILLAGYLCHKQNIKEFYGKKVRRILIPFLFMSALKLLSGNLIWTELSHPGTLPEQLSDAFLRGGLYWFSYCLLVLFLLAPLFWDRTKLVWILLILTLAANIYIRQNEIQLTSVLQLGQVLRMSPYFLTGMLLAKYDAPKRLAGGKNSWIALAVSLAVAGVCGYFRFHEDVHTSYYLDFMMGLSLMYVLYFIACRIRGSAARKILELPGRYTYQLMLLEGFFRILIYRGLNLLLPAGMVLIIISTVLILVISCLACVLAEKIPVLSTLLGLKELPSQKKISGI